MNHSNKKNLFLVFKKVALILINAQTMFVRSLIKIIKRNKRDKKIKQEN